MVKTYKKTNLQKKTGKKTLPAEDWLVAWLCVLPVRFFTLVWWSHFLRLILITTTASIVGACLVVAAGSSG